MKKTLYIAASLIAVASCSKSELNQEISGTRDIAVSVRAAVPATKSVFDGEGLVAFESGDKFNAAIAKPSSPAEAVKVASSKGYLASQYYYGFTIEDASAASPEFSGHFYSIVGDDFSDEYIMYGVSGELYNSGSDLTQWKVQVKDTQSPSQTSWDCRYDAMVIKPVTISTADNSYDEKYDEYSTNNAEKVEFAHLFGFADISFADIPEEYRDNVVKSIVVEATGENKDLVGVFTVDVTADVDTVTLTPFSSYSSVTLKGDGITTVSDYHAWLVLNPGLYDVKITVSTARADLVFERSGLNVVRSSIARPTVHFKSADTAEIKDVILSDGELWSAGLSYLNYINSYNPERAWGPDGKKMVFSISYPGANNVNYGSGATDSDGSYVQVLAYSNISGGSVILRSDASFGGVKMIKMNLGVATDNASGDFTVSLVNGDEVNELGKVTVTGKTGNYDAKYLLFNAEKTSGYGDLVLTFDNITESNCRPFVGNITINPAPWFDIESRKIKVGKAASSSELSCPVYAASEAPEVVSTESWITASYADGKLSCAIEENTGVKRSAKVYLYGKGLSEVKDSVEFIQESATAKTYKLSVSSADLYKMVTAAKDSLETAGITVGDYSSYKIHGKFTAVATDGSGAEKNVKMIAEAAHVAESTESVFYFEKGFYCASPVGEISRIAATASKKMIASNYNFTAKLSEDGNSWTMLNDFVDETSSDPYSSYALNDNDLYSYFNLYNGNWSKIGLYSFEVTFTAD